MMSKLLRIKNKIIVIVISVLIFFSNVSFGCEKHPDAIKVKDEDGRFVCGECYPALLNQSSSELNIQPLDNRIDDLEKRKPDMFSNMGYWDNRTGGGTGRKIETISESSAVHFKNESVLSEEVWDTVQYTDCDPGSVSSGFHSAEVTENVMSLINESLLYVGLCFDVPAKNVDYLKMRMESLESYLGLLSWKRISGNITVENRKARLELIDAQAQGAGVGILPGISQIIKELPDEKYAILEIKVEGESCYFLMVIDPSNENVYLINGMMFVAIANGDDLIQVLDGLFFEVKIHKVEFVPTMISTGKKLFSYNQHAWRSRMEVGQVYDCKSSYSQLMNLVAKLNLSKDDIKYYGSIRDIARALNGRIDKLELSEVCEFKAIDLEFLLSQVDVLPPPLANPEVGIMRFALNCRRFCTFKMDEYTYMKRCRWNNEQGFLGFITTLIAEAAEKQQEGILDTFYEAVKREKKKSWLLKAPGMSTDKIMVELFIVRIQDGKWNIIQPFTGYWVIPYDKCHLTDVYKVLNIIFDNNSLIEFYDVTHKEIPDDGAPRVGADGVDYTDTPELVGDPD